MLAGQIFIALVGFSKTLANPDLVDIPIFTTLLTQQGITRVGLILMLQIAPFVLAVVAALWIYFGTHHGDFPLWFGLGLVSLYVFQGGVGHGLVAAWGTVGYYLDNLMMATGVLVFFLFPSGHFYPRWAPGVALALLAPLLYDPTLTQDARQMLAGEESISAGRALGVVSIISLLLFLVVVQAVRYFRHSSVTERLQTKWLLLGGFVWATPVALAFALMLAGQRGRLLGFLLALTAFGSYLIPIACAIAITKHRLYDIGRVVSRTVTYSVVAGSVALLYVAGVALMRFLFPLSGSLGVAASTLAAVAAISPLYRRVRKAVDRRFNRARYDAQVESAAFGNRLQSALDFDQLISDIGDVLRKTVQPASTAIWTNSIRPGALEVLRPAARGDSPPAN